MSDEIGHEQAGIAAFALMQHLLRLLTQKGVVSSTDLAGLFAKVREEIPAADEYERLAVHLEALTANAREDMKL